MAPLTPQASGLQNIPLALSPGTENLGLDEPQCVYPYSTHTLLILYSYSTHTLLLFSPSDPRSTLHSTTYPHSICVCSLLLYLLSSFSLPYRFLCPLPPRHHHASLFLHLLLPSHPSPPVPPLPPAFAPSFSSAPLPALSPNPILWYGVSKESRPSRSIMPSNYSNPHAICGSTTSMTAPSSHHLHVQ